LPFANEWAIIQQERRCIAWNLTGGDDHVPYPSALEPNPDGIYTVTSPDVPGLVTEGRTPAEILSNVEEALAALLEA